MSDKRPDIEKTINHWITRSDQDYKTMIHLFNSKDYHWALFIGHLVIERLLKAIVVKNTHSHAPFSHDLRRLAKLSEVEFNDEYKRWFDTITTFNLNARYDDYKHNFYKKCTKNYANTWVLNIKILRKWIKKKL
ncbi:MAG: HEPN domain-containing protein [Cyclobacteriaceae bacterium]|nr:HEPN domain-containing protein [Cyclobacteriaceae bacterium]